MITTPGVAYLTRTGPFVAGVMISASHNPYHDNGLKVISHSGYKLPDPVELELETLIAEWLAQGKEAEPAKFRSTAVLIILCALTWRRRFLAASRFAWWSIAPMAPRRKWRPLFLSCLEADVDWIGASPDGRNINLNCGSLHLDRLQRQVVSDEGRSRHRI